MERLERQDFSDCPEGVGPESHAQTGCIFSDVPCSFPRNRGSSPDARSPQLAASAASVSLFLLPDKFVKAIFLNISEVFQHAHMIFCLGSVCPALSVCGRGILHIRSKKFFCSHIFGLNNSGRLFFFAAMTASMADKPFALISLAQGAVHSAGSDQVYRVIVFSP
ncbi:MAG: hypothetical protein V8Q30_10245 [Acutalibacteraceae bacterium]